jgi:hypothetical protein
MFLLASRMATLFQREIPRVQNDGEISAQLLVYGALLIGKGNSSIVSIVTC